MKEQPRGRGTKATDEYVQNETRREPTSELQGRERDYWSNFLRTAVEVPPIPSLVTKDMEAKLAVLEMEICSLPKLNIGTLDDLRRIGSGAFLTRIEQRYPGLRVYESLNDTEKQDHTIARLPRKWFWEQTLNGKVDFPAQEPHWVFVEMVKPDYFNRYAETPITARLGLPDRFKARWENAKKGLNRIKPDLLSTLGLIGKADMRFLTALEWNLLGNREGWGKANLYEWVEDEYRESGDSRHLMVGYSAYGGAAYVAREDPSYSNDSRVGFRVAVDLGSG